MKRPQISIGAKIGFVSGAVAILPFAFYAGLAVGNYFAKHASGGRVFEMMMWVIGFNAAALCVIAIDGCIGAMLGGAIHFIVRHSKT